MNHTPTTITHLTISVAAGQTVMTTPATHRRNFLAIYNTGANPGYLRFGQPNKATAAFANGDIPIPAGGNIGPFYDQVPIDSVNLAAPNGDTTFTVVQGLPYQVAR